MTQPLDGILIETTGLANPSPVIQTFTRDAVASEFTEMDAVITMVDAVHSGRHFKDGPAAAAEFEAQIQYADRILLNKVGSPSLSLARSAIRLCSP